MNLPNKLTVLRMCMVPVFVWLYLAGFFLWALAVFALASITDALDGNIARKQGLVTNFGKLMDPLADKVLVMSAIVCFAAVGKTPAWVVILVLAREFFVTSVRSIAASAGVVMAADIWGKLKTIFQMVWICLELLTQGLIRVDHSGSSIVVSVSRLGLALGTICTVLLWAVVVLTVFSGFNYWRKNRGLFSDM